MIENPCVVYKKKDLIFLVVHLTDLIQQSSVNFAGQISRDETWHGETKKSFLRNVM